MKKINIKRKLAVTLTAAMVFTMAAPAVPAHAAVGDITFDFTEMTPSVGTVQNITINGAGGSAIAATNGVLPNPAPTTGRFLANSTGSIYMPYWNGGFNHTGNHATFNGEDFKLDGYVITGWYRDKASIYNHSNKNFMDEQYYPYVDGTKYIAVLAADPSTTKVYEYKESHKPVNTTIVVPSELNVEVTNNKHVLEGVQASPKIIPGYKLAAGGVSSKVKMSSSSYVDTTGGANIFAGDTGKNFKYENGQVNGTMVNKPLEVAFRYEVDNSQLFSIKVKHKLDGGTPVVDRTLREFAVNTDLATKNIKPDRSLIEPVGGDTQPRYTLSSVDIKNADDNAVTSSSSLLGLSDGGITYKPVTDPIATKGMITGKMINQGLTVTYNYTSNPAYYMTLSVRYEDTNGVNLTDKVAAKVAGNIAADINSSTATRPARASVGTPNDKFVYKVPTSGGSYTVYAPVLDGYTTNPPPAISVGNSTQYDNSNFSPPSNSGWSTGTPVFTVNAGSAPQGSAEVVVTYNLDNNNLANASFASSMGGKLMVGNTEYDASNLAHQVSFIKQNKIASPRTYDLVIPSGKLPTPVADDGYKFVSWQLDKKDGNNFVDITVPGTYTLPDPAPSIPPTPDLVRFNARFAEDPDQWSTFRFQIADSSLTDNGLTTSVKLVNKQGGLPRVLKWSDVNTTDLQNAVTAPAGKTVKWFDENNQEMRNDSVLVNNATYKAYAVSPSTGTVNVPTVTPVVDPISGVPSLRVTSAIDTDLRYIVTDQTGRVVLDVPGTSLVAGGSISGTGINPGYTYRVHTALSGAAGITVGQPIPAAGSDISAGSPDVTVPATATPPAVIEDPNNPGRRTIIVTPVAPDTEYKLVDAAGNEVYDYVAPISGKVEFTDLDPNVNYTVVPRRSGDTLTAPPNSAGVVVNTGTLTPLVMPRKVSLILPSGMLPQVAKLDGSSVISQLERLNSVQPGTLVEITLRSMDMSTNNIFSGNFVTTGITNPNITGTYISFTMPNNDVTVQAVYSAPGVTWDSGTPPSSTGGNPVLDQSNGKVAVEVPNITTPGEYRLRIVRDTNVPDTIKDDIQAQEGDTPYTALWQAKAVVEVWNGSAWETYTGNVDALRATFNTGSLTQGNREYRLYESVASASNATRLNGTYEAEWTQANYTGSFETAITNGSVYTFGYIEHPSYNIRIKSTREGSVNIGVFVRRGKSLSDYADKYQAELDREKALPDIDINGITWIFRGLSSSRTEFIEYDDTKIANSDGVIYIYFDNDRKSREDAFGELRKGITEAANIAASANPGTQARIQDAIDEANQVLNMSTPRKASKEELRNAYTKLRNTLMELLGSGSGSGGSSGGSGGGSGGGGAMTTNSGKSIKVGTDGTWQLVDDQRHIWRFNLTSGSKITGWARLAYTSNGVTKTGWYHFNSGGDMDTGWFESGGKWYFLSTAHNGFYGEMLTGWYYDTTSGKWYYLDESGAMVVGWYNIGGKWYYLSNTSSNNQPYGSLYVSTSTPDGYKVNENGEWIQ